MTNPEDREQAPVTRRTMLRGRGRRRGGAAAAGRLRRRWRRRGRAGLVGLGRRGGDARWPRPTSGGRRHDPPTEVVVTQPEKGKFKAFTAICTHQGCTVSKVHGREDRLPVPRQHFSITDGSPEGGPAQSALAEKKVSVEGGQIRSA